MVDACAPLWERPVLRQAAGETLRPGGFALTDRACELIGVAPGWRVLDVGSGLGATVARLRARYGADAWGVEPSGTQAARSGSAHLVRGLGDALPFGSGTFDAVFCECVLSLLPDAGAGLDEFHRVLAPGGFLVLADLCASSGSCGCGPAGDASPGGPGSCADRAPSVSAVRALAEARGFSVRAVEDHSRHLRDLAARLILAGEPPARCGRGLGYYLMITTKQGDGDGR